MLCCRPPHAGSIRACAMQQQETVRKPAGPCQAHLRLPSAARCVARALERQAGVPLPASAHQPLHERDAPAERPCGCGPTPASGAGVSVNDLILFARAGVAPGINIPKQPYTRARCCGQTARCRPCSARAHCLRMVCMRASPFPPVPVPRQQRRGCRPGPCDPASPLPGPAGMRPQTSSGPP